MWMSHVAHITRLMAHMNESWHTHESVVTYTRAATHNLLQHTICCNTPSAIVRAGHHCTSSTLPLQHIATRRKHCNILHHTARNRNSATHFNTCKRACSLSRYSQWFFTSDVTFTFSRTVFSGCWLRTSCIPATYLIDNSNNVSYMNDVSHIWIMCHTYESYVTHMNHVSHIWMPLLFVTTVTHANESCLVYVTHANESGLIYEWVMSQIGMSLSRTNGGCCVSRTPPFWWVLCHCTGFTRLVWGRALRS